MNGFPLRGVALGLALAVWTATPAAAQMAVIDGAAVTQLIEQVAGASKDNYSAISLWCREVAPG